MNLFLVLLETSGNQEFLFSTNMLRDITGASELTYRAGTRFVLDAVAATTGRPSLWHDAPPTLRRNLCDAACNPPIESMKADVEVVIATSGKALLLARSQDIATAIVRRATETALVEAPGLDLAGCHVPVDLPDMQNESSLPALVAAVAEVYREFGRVRAVRTSSRARFPTLPIVAPCRTSGMPAFARGRLKRSGTEDEKNVDASRASLEKWKARELWYERLQATFPEARYPEFQDVEDQVYHKNASELFEERFAKQPWLAVIAADGNRIGRIFLEFECFLPSAKRHPRGYLDQLRDFSCQLEDATEKAFAGAVDKTWPDFPLIAPLILGGDDFTAVCEGTHALGFAREFLLGFERETAANDRAVLCEVSRAIRGGKGDERLGLTAAAGVAVIKPHFPFYAGYSLAKQLTGSAKKASACGHSTLDFHYLFDSVFSDLDVIRERLLVDDSTVALFARPYVVSAGALSDPWAQAHDIAGLDARVAALRGRDTGDDADETESGERRVLPRAQAHDLLEGLGLGRHAADARMRLIRSRYADSRLDVLLEETGETPSLFRTCTPLPVGANENPAAGPKYETRFLDALEVDSMQPMEHGDETEEDE